MPKQSNKPPEPAARRTQLAAADLLRTALSDLMRVEAQAGDPATLRLTPAAADLRALTVRLRPWRSAADAKGAPPQTVWILRHPAPELPEELRRRDLSFADLKRRMVRLRAPGLVVERTVPRGETGRQAPASTRSPFGDRASLVTRALLAAPTEEWTISSLAAEAGVSLALVSRVIDYLQMERLVEPRRVGAARSVRLPSPWPLFERWAAEYRMTRNTALTVAPPIGDARKALRRIAGELGAGGSAYERWALTGPAAAELVAPHATWDVIHAYVDVRTVTELEQVARSCGWEPSAAGRLVLYAPEYRESVWWRVEEHQGLPVVHPIQLMLDLWHYPVRGREAAEHVARRLRWPAP